MRVRALHPEDRNGWEELWCGYLRFYDQVLAPEVTDTIWARFLDPAEPMEALVAEENGVLLGLVHCVFHRGTWSVNDVCYLEDLFTAEAARGRGIGRALIEAVYARAREMGCGRVYWLTHETNKTAQALYDKLADKPGFIQYSKLV
ncbi:GNAT family N-acetyltransferase [Acidocella aminolytica]|jgi:GNAT superfamily N-acetyltransferase|uniref:N-acetyltransferase GCN5 n=1 Tax=Acidocella aminolytica 101 = DSM 11237 TaxID=1120923 RepID=A0A0D6PH29_9PROT|nr:GNAT family N-acetyltransferase [Acidocella aminolytica]GAN80661.1 N-acetyltransferase GCN5 [Acidocella aminolytica 101 = DSM 11237]GBQ37443.1 N-acetyltransferase GCN5 [Acidocella aminolytica 101 = DSM 11237]SHE54827.1 Acetyltransferase (GNAT) family protein [Acidocella aminolytica 101 = DSM 11237]